MLSAHRAVRAALRGVSPAVMSLGVAALMLNTGCYAYNARSMAELAPGEHVTVELNSAGRTQVAPTLGDSIVRLRGDFVSSGADGLHINVTDVQFASQISSPRSLVPITLPSAAYDSVTTRKLEKASTVWIGLGVAAAITVLIMSVNTNPSGTVNPTDPKPPNGTGN